VSGILEGSGPDPRYRVDDSDGNALDAAEETEAQRTFKSRS
jgi:hypothetical protein